jgi:hypothetical protein
VADGTHEGLLSGAPGITAGPLFGRSRSKVTRSSKEMLPSSSSRLWQLRQWFRKIGSTRSLK